MLLSVGKWTEFKPAQATQQTHTDKNGCYNREAGIFQNLLSPHYPVPFLSEAVGTEQPFLRLPTAILAE